MVTVPRYAPLELTERERAAMMAALEDDSEEAPWMVMGDLQFWSASDFAHALRQYARAAHPEWYVASMLPILYTWRGESRKRVLAPDAFVALAPDHPRQSFDTTVEGTAPPFVLEVVSPSSVERDELAKVVAYDELGVSEYALFTPRLGRESSLTGYRRDEAGTFVPWLPDEHGRLWSDVLGLFLVVRGRRLQPQLPDGRFLLTLDQAVEALGQAEAARREAEAEAARLRHELARLRGESDPGETE